MHKIAFFATAICFKITSMCVGEGVRSKLEKEKD